jgi:DNA-binding SARP family transcriptional activator/tetratricopeptide (TPR) repeat protein/DNA-binding Xre family transcriptional regulator
MANDTVTRRIADRLRVLRSQRGWSARQLADECARAGGGTLTRGTIAKIESGGRKYVTADELIVLARVLETSVEDLLTHRADASEQLAAPWTRAAEGATDDRLRPRSVFAHDNRRSDGMAYRMLGELEIGVPGRLIDLPAGATLMVLAALLINANRSVSKAMLIHLAWDSDDVGEAQLPKRIGMLRDLLVQVGRRDDLRTHAGFGYELRVATDDVDVLCFQQLLRQADEVGMQQRTGDEIGLLRQALGLWRGPHPLSNVSGQAFRHDTVALEQRHKRAAARLFELEFRRGNHDGVLDELILIAGYYPADRRLCEQLMIAAYRCGHVADVSEAYERYRAALAEETGSDPDPLLRNLHFAIARGDQSAISAVEAELTKRAGTRPVRLALTVPAQLPRPAELVGREDLAAEVTWLLRREPRPGAPVIVISGPGGIGKTALALCAAHESRDRYPDGQLFMELRGATGNVVDTSEVAAQFLHALSASRVPETKAERLAEYRTLLAGRRILIVLDDAADGWQVSELLPASPGCAVLVTARQRLPEITGAHHLASLEPLDHADAVELFLRLVRDAGIEIDPDPGAVDRVVTLCGGLPLALRIAGALRVHDHPRPTAELAERLARQGPEAFAYGRLSVARTIGAGFERLNPAARQLFLGLGLLPLIGFGLWTAAAMLDYTATDGTGAGSPEARGAAALAELAASFMVESVEAEKRYRFHHLTREYARRRALAEYPGDRDVVPVRVYRALLTLARRAHASLYGGDFELVHSDIPIWDAPRGLLAEIDAAPLDWFEKERLNIRGAVEHCAELGLVDLCWDLAVSAHEFYTIRSYFDDWYATHTLALHACRAAGDKRGEGIVLACLNQPALVASRRADSASAIADLERAASLLTEERDQRGQAITMRTLAHMLRRQGHLTRPLAMFSEALAYYTASGDPVGRWQTLRFIGQTYLDLGDHSSARRALDEAETVAIELGGKRLVAQTRYWIGQACLAAADLGAAQVAFDSVLDVYNENTGVGHGYARHGLGEVAWRMGEYGGAEEHFAMAAELARESADAVLEGRVWLSVAALRGAERRSDAQATALQQAVEVFAGCGAARLEARALATLAQVMSDRGDLQAAEQLWARVEILYNAADLPEQDRIHHRLQL